MDKCLLGYQGAEFIQSNTCSYLYEQNGYVIAHFAKTTENEPQTVVFYPDGKRIYVIDEATDKVTINREDVMV